MYVFLHLTVLPDARGEPLRCSGEPEPGNQVTLVISVPIWQLTVEPLSSKYHRMRIHQLLYLVTVSPSQRNQPSLYLPKYLCHPFSRGWNSFSCAQFCTKENKPSTRKMSDLLIIYVAVLCLQTMANIVNNKGEKKKGAFWKNVSLPPYVSTVLSFPSEILIKFMQMTSPLQKCKCGSCMELWAGSSAENPIFCPPGRILQIGGFWFLQGV